MAMERKPRVFVGCSREAVNYARAVSSLLEYEAEVNPWYAGTFGANDYTMEALERELETSDFAVFLFAADDVALIRGKAVFVPRDNTVFELGLFWGKLGRRRVFALVPREVDGGGMELNGMRPSGLHLLSDLAGLTLLRYNPRRDGKYQAAVDTAAGEVLAAIRREQLFEDPRLALVRKQSILHFFWEYVRHVTISDPEIRYAAYAEAIRNSLLAPPGCRVTGAAIWKQDGDYIGQVGGNVGRGRMFRVDGSHPQRDSRQRIGVVAALTQGEWSFFSRREIADVHILCYPLGKNHVLSVHFSGGSMEVRRLLEWIVESNEELLLTVKYLVGGDSR